MGMIWRWGVASCLFLLPMVQGCEDKTGKKISTSLRGLDRFAAEWMCRSWLQNLSAHLVKHWINVSSIASSRSIIIHYAFHYISLHFIAFHYISLHLCAITPKGCTGCWHVLFPSQTLQSFTGGHGQLHSRHSVRAQAMVRPQSDTMRHPTDLLVLQPQIMSCSSMFYLWTSLNENLQKTSSKDTRECQKNEACWHAHFLPSWAIEIQWIPWWWLCIATAGGDWNVIPTSFEVSMKSVSILLAFVRRPRNPQQTEAFHGAYQWHTWSILEPNTL